MKYSYEVTPRPAELGGGWRLRLLEDGEEVGGGVFPVAQDEPGGIAWWNALSEAERGDWLKRSALPVVADAYLLYLRDEARRDAEDTAQEWLDTRD
jgi:hypothetical protein